MHTSVAFLAYPRIITLHSLPVKKGALYLLLNPTCCGTNKKIYPHRSPTGHSLGQWSGHWSIRNEAESCYNCVKHWNGPDHCPDKSLDLFWKKRRNFLRNEDWNRNGQYLSSSLSSCEHDCILLFSLNDSHFVFITILIPIMDEHFIFFMAIWCCYI